MIRAGLQFCLRPFTVASSQTKSLSEIMGMEKLSAPSGSILEQYKLFTSQHPSCMVIMQVGDFYEFYGESAEKASRLLDIALGKTGSGVNKVPFTGFPVRSLQVHLGKLLKQGESVVICEQYQERHRNSFRRRISRIVTPGTITDAELLEAGQNNFLLAIEKGEGLCALAWSDISTGQVMLRSVSHDRLSAEIRRINPTEVLGSLIDGVKSIDSAVDPSCVELFYPEAVSFESFTELEMNALHRLLSYVKQTQLSSLPQLSIPTKSNEERFMFLPQSVLQSLEITNSDTKEGLISRLNLAKTAPGQRFFQERCLFPSMDINEINRRLDSVEYYVKNEEARLHVRQRLDGLTDFCRSYQRLRSGKSGFPLRDLKCVVDALNAGEELGKTHNLKIDGSLIEFKTMFEGSLDHSGSRIFRKGFNTELDSLYDELECNDDVKMMEEKLKDELQIDSLTVVSVRNVYYVEVPRNRPITHPDFHMETATTSKLRYKHKDVDSVVLQRELVQRSIQTLEQQLLFDISKMLNSDVMDKFIHDISELDVFAACAEIAETNQYCRPQLFSDSRYNVVMGRHPIVEQLRKSTFVRNSLSLSHFALVTGPNMGGKSTFLKQTALIAIMAQTGMFVPATKAEIGLVDAIFTRVGASDDITTNQSTFMVEMAETSEILRNATPRSLVLMDEVGRGTAWEEGYSLAYAIVKYLMDHVKARCLFATHYFELEGLVKARGQSLLKTDAAIGPDGSLTPFYSVTEGVAEHSFAIAVARAAGLPNVVLDEALRKWKELKERI